MHGVKITYFIKPIPKEAEGVISCTFGKCRNKGNWNLNNGNAIYCDRHLCNLMRNNEGSYLITNKSLKSLLYELEVKENED